MISLIVFLNGFNFFLFLGLGFYLKNGHFRRNHFFGVRTQNSLASEEDWIFYNTKVGEIVVRSSFLFLLASLLLLVSEAWKLNIEEVWIKVFAVVVPLLIVLILIWLKINSINRSRG
jgi:hypothetical protein